MHVSDAGYFAHFNVGLLIGSLVSYLIFKKTGNKIKSFVFGILIAILIGALKEIVDPYWGHSLDKYDLIYTVLGGVVGSLIILAIKNFWRK